MKVALYARVSSEAQEARGTIASQVEALRQRMRELEYEIVAEFLDNGQSGARLDRPGLDAMRDAAEAGLFQAVWCLTPDRLARSYAYQVLVLDELARLGVEVHFLDAPPIEDDPQAKLLVQVQGVIAEYERAKIAERYRRGKLFRARAGEIVFWKVSYGYRRVSRSPSGPARLEIYEPEAEVVRRIFDDYVTGGLSVRGIIRGLYEDGIVTPRGGPLWSTSTLSGMLRNPAYKGTALYNQRRSEQRPGRRPVPRRRPPEDWIEVPVPALVSEDVFEAAQNISHQNSDFSARRTTPGSWLLRGLVVCGHCGIKAQCSRAPTSRGGHNFCYYCPYRDPIRADRRCRQSTTRAHELDAFVWEQIREALLRPELLLAGEQAVIAREPVPDDELLQRQLERLARRLDQADLERRRLIDLYQLGLIDLPELQRREREVATRRAQLDEERQALATQRRQLSNANRLRRRLTAFAEWVRQGIDELTFEERQRLLRLVVEEVRVTSWQVDIRLRIPLDPPPDEPPPPGPPRGRRPGPEVSTKLRLRSVRGDGSRGLADM